MKRAVVFGVFDRFHPGHEWFLLEASKLCNHLTVVVARDEDVLSRKGRTPSQSLSQRLQTVQEFLPFATVTAGDNAAGEWMVFTREPIDICVVGYDQDALHKALAELKERRQLSFELILLKPYFPEKYKTSLYV